MVVSARGQITVHKGVFNQTLSIYEHINKVNLNKMTERYERLLN